MCMANNGKYTKHASHNTRRIYSVRNGEKYKIRKIDWCEGGLQLVYIGTNNVGEHDLTPIMKFIMVILDN